MLQTYIMQYIDLYYYRKKSYDNQNFVNNGMKLM